ncbi:MAG TPA: hypothetical protein VFI31_02675 [Pirellulales bacterium]|nr:hypothetical protein [Pirellulales bacterium]
MKSSGWLLLTLVGVLVLAGCRAGLLALNTLLLSSAVVALTVPIGCVLAVLTSRTDLPGRRFSAAVLAGLLLVPLFVQAGAWQAALGADGWFTSSIAAPPLIDGWRGAIWIHSVAALPWVVFIVASGLMFVERELEEQALLDGASWQVALQVTLRRSAGAIGIAAVWVALVAAGEMAVTDFFQVRTFAEELYTAFALGDVQPTGGSGDPGANALTVGIPGTAGVWVGMVVIAAMLAGALLLVRGLVSLTRRPGRKSPHVFHLGAWRWFTSASVFVVLGLLAGLPLTSLAWKAGVEVVDAPHGRVRQWSASKCVDMIALNPTIAGGRLKIRHQKELGWSLAVGTIAATACLTLAFPVAWFAGRGGWRTATGLAAVVWLWAVPRPVIGLAIIALMNRPEIPGLTYLYDRTISPLVLACMAHSLPLATLVLWSSFCAVPKEFLENAQLEGANLPQRWWHVVLPLRWRVLVVAWIVAFVWSLAELDASVLVAPPGITPLSSHIFGLLHFGAQDQVAGLCLAFFLAVEIAAAVCWAFLHRWSTASRS